MDFGGGDRQTACFTAPVLLPWSFLELVAHTERPWPLKSSVPCEALDSIRHTHCNPCICVLKVLQPKRTVPRIPQFPRVPQRSY